MALRIKFRILLTHINPMKTEIEIQLYEIDKDQAGYFSLIQALEDRLRIQYPPHRHPQGTLNDRLRTVRGAPG